jgi:hypothetical protein
VGFCAIIIKKRHDAVSAGSVFWPYEGGGSFDGAVTMSSECDAITAANLPIFGGGAY